MREFDYIIVGAGSAGCALANKLTANPNNNVLLIEAGRRDVNPFIHMPRGFAKILSNVLDTWHIPMDKNVAGPETVWVRGKVLGGSSAINGQVYMRGRPADYDGLNVPGWSWKDVGRVFEEIENHELGPAEDRGSGGPLKISVHPKKQPVADAVIEALVAQGAVEAADINQVDQDAVGYLNRTIYKGKRQSAAVAFLKPIESRPNLTIQTETEVLRVVFEGKRAIGVEAQNSAGKEVIRAKTEVILSAGALLSPKILMLSGVGPADTLKKFGIDVLVDAPQVGQNMVEQLGFIPIYRLTHGSDNHRLRGFGLILSVLEYTLFKTGPLSYAAFELVSQFSTRPGLNRPDANFQFTSASAALNEAGNGIVPENLPGATLSTYITRPKSRGFITITSADPAAPIHCDPRYLTHEDDRRATVALFRRLRVLFQHPALKKFGFEEVVPGPSVNTDEEIIDFILKKGSYALHALGTCRMGTDESSVVDPRLRVRGVTGLRVSDISVLPEMVSTNTNAPAMMIGWRTGQLIGEDHP